MGLRVPFALVPLGFGVILKFTILKCPLLALHTAFGSFYCDEVEISSRNVVPLMAVACMFQLVSSTFISFHPFLNTQSTCYAKKRHRFVKELLQTIS